MVPHCMYVRVCVWHCVDVMCVFVCMRAKKKKQAAVLGAMMPNSGAIRKAPKLES